MTGKSALTEKNCTNLMKPKKHGGILKPIWKTISILFLVTTGVLLRIQEVLGRLIKVQFPAEHGLFTGLSQNQFRRTGLDFSQELTIASRTRLITCEVASILPLATIKILPSILDWLILTLTAAPPSVVNFLVRSS